MEQGIFYIVLGVFSILAFGLGKYVFPQMKDVASNLLSAYPMLMKWGISACQLVEQYCEELCNGEKGEKKNITAAKIIKDVADKVGLTLTDEQARAIAQAAYNEWVNGVGRKK